MRVFFDVNGTLIGRDGILRPHAREVLERLKADGNDIYLWSILGPRWDVVEQHHLAPLVSGCLVKPSLGKAPWVTVLRLRKGATANPDLCVDDAPIYVKAFGGVVVRSYKDADPEDRELLTAYNAIAHGSWQKAHLWRFFLRTTVAAPLFLVLETARKVFRSR